MKLVIKGGKGSGWHAPPKGTHTGDKHRAVGSGKAKKKTLGDVIPGGGGSGEEKPKKSTFGSSTPVSTDHIGEDMRGVNTVYIVTFEDGTKGIMKSSSKHGSTEGEVIASEFDKSIGWGIVPETVMYADEYGNIRSLQKFVPDSRDGFTISSNLRNILHNGEDAARMRVMDAVFGNDDRHLGNMLVSGAAHKLHAIDNGGFFGIGIHRKGAQHVYTPAVMRSTDFAKLGSVDRQAWGEAVDWWSTKGPSWATEQVHSGLMTTEQRDILSKAMESNVTEWDYYAANYPAD